MTIIKLKDNQLIVAQEVIDELVLITEQQKTYDERLAQIKEAIKQAMEDNGVKSFKSELLDITYIEAQERVIVDTEKLKTEHEEVYLECVKKSTTKPSIRFKLK